MMRVLPPLCSNFEIDLPQSESFRRILRGLGIDLFSEFPCLSLFDAASPVYLFFSFLSPLRSSSSCETFQRCSSSFLFPLPILLFVIRLSSFPDLWLVTPLFVRFFPKQIALLPLPPSPPYSRICLLLHFVPGPF